MKFKAKLWDGRDVYERRELNHLEMANLNKKAEEATDGNLWWEWDEDLKEKVRRRYGK